MITEDHPRINRAIHPPVLLFTHLLAAFLLNWWLPLPYKFPKPLVWIGYVLAAAALGLAFSAVNQFAKIHTTLDPHGSVRAIVTSGPYRFSRNPIYLSFVFLLVGFSFIFKTYWGLLLSPVLILSLYSLVIKHEEAYLTDKFGPAYTSYTSRVRRWL